MTKKEPMRGLFRDDPATPEGKYLVKRRDGTVPEWPNLVLGAADPVAAIAIRAYGKEVLRLCREDAAQAERLGFLPKFGERMLRLADEFDSWRRRHGAGDPGKGRHRVDDPEIIEEMKKGLAS
jgi:hypothetical protein